MGPIMTWFCCCICCLFSSIAIVTVIASPIEKKALPWEGSLLATKSKRATRLLDECLLVGVEEATYIYKSTGEDAVCGLYIVSKVDQRIEISIDYLHVDCTSGGLVTLLDGWEMSGEVFPPFEGEPMESRVTNFCGSVRKQHVVTSSNAATLLYKMPSGGDKFRVTIKFLTNPKPCNMLLTSDSEVVTLRNHGLRRNCTLACAFPAVIKIFQLSVGIESQADKFNHHHIESGLLTRCHKRGFSDMVLIGGSNGLDTSALQIQELFCGLDSNPSVPSARVLCEVSSVRLVSSGLFDNSVTVTVKPLTSLQDLPTLMCQPNDE